MPKRMTVRLTDEAVTAIDIIRADLLSRMPMSDEITDTKIINHALRTYGEQIRQANPAAKPPAKTRRRPR